MTRSPVMPVFNDAALAVVAVVVGIAAVVEYVTTGTVGTRTLVVTIVATLVGNATHKGRGMFAREGERGTKEHKKMASTALDVKESGNKRTMKKREKV
jgi:hypothetical protein